jgi:hypothetical protein
VSTAAAVAGLRAGLGVAVVAGLAIVAVAWVLRPPAAAPVEPEALVTVD